LGVPEAFFADDAEVERVAALGWRGLEEERLGGWLLRAGGGFTARANSVLALGPPGRSLPAALEHVNGWYAARGLPALLSVPLPLRAELHADLLALGWALTRTAEVLVGDVAAMAAENTGPARTSDRVQVDRRPGEAWLTLYDPGGPDLPSSAVDVLTRGEVVGFVSVVRDGAVVAIGRGAVAEGWVGLSAVEVAVSARRQGLGAQVVGALLAWGAANGARSAYLQVLPDNAPARMLYARLGFVRHHRYDYLTGPRPDPPPRPVRRLAIPQSPGV
jgi:N-acetylglutamate synthase